MHLLNRLTKILTKVSRKKRAQKSTGSAVRQLQIEPLEDRMMLAVGFGNGSVGQELAPVGNTSTLAAFTAGSGNDRVLVVQVGTFGNVTNVTFNGQPLTSAIDQVHSTSTLRQEIWYATLGSGAATTGDVVVTGVAGSTTIGANVFNGVDQATPVDNFNTRQFNIAATSSTLNVNSDSGDMVFDGVHWQAAFPNSTTPGANQIQSYSFLTSSPSATVLAASYEPGPGPVVMSETFNAVQVNNGLHGALNINQVATDIRGRKFEDLNADGTDDGGTDPGLANVTIRLYRDGGNKKFGSDGQGANAGTRLNGDDDVLVETKLTTASGSYEFRNLLDGTYYVQEIVPTNFAATTPTYLTFVSAGGNDFTGQNFGNTVLGSIHGFKFQDNNLDGVYTQGIDQPLRNQLFQLTGTDGQGNVIDWTVRSDANGRFQFTNLWPSVNGQGSATGYTVSEVPSNHYVPTTGTSWFTDLQSRQEYSAFAGQAALNPQQVAVVVGTPLIFGNTPSCSLHGFKFEDVNADGVYQSGTDQPLANVTFTLTGQNAMGQPVNLTTTTNARGEFEFTHLMASNATGYAVSEVLPAGHVATTPTSYTQVVNPGQEFVANAGQAKLVDGVWGVQPDTGMIVKLDPVYGATLKSFPAPTSVQPNDPVGLTVAEGGTTLLYSNGRVNRNMVYRLDPYTGDVLSTETITGVSGGGLSYDSAVDGILALNGGVMVQDGFSGPVHILYSGVPAARGALGGDDSGLGFVARNDNQIAVFDSATGVLIRNFYNYVPDTAGLAYDGTWLYASSANGYVYWLNPNNGAFVWWTFVSGGELTGLAAYDVPQTEVLAGKPLMFGNTVTGSIHGVKFEDLDGDGEFDAGEPRVTGVTFTITGTDGLGNAVNQTALTDANGEFWFTNLMPSVKGVGPGTGYTVTETVPAGWMSTTPTSYTADLFSRSELVGLPGQAMIPQSDPRVEVVVGKPLVFGNTVLGSIHAIKYEDFDGDGKYDAPHVDQQQSIGNSVTVVGNEFVAAQIFIPGETMFVDGVGLRAQRNGIPGDLTVEIQEVMGGVPNGHVLATTMISQNNVPEASSASVVADFSFANLLLFAGRQYAIVVSAPPSGVNTYFISQEPDGNHYASGQAVFSNNGGSTWTYFATPNADLLFSTILFEPPVEDVEFKVEGTDGQGNVVSRTGRTNDKGEVWFNGLWPSVAGEGQGTGYVLTETVPNGWINTTPTTYSTNLFSRHEYTALPGQAMLPVGDLRIEVVVGDALRFGNTVTSSIHGFKFEDVNGNALYDAPQIDQQQTTNNSTLTISNQRVAQTFTSSFSTTLERLSLMIQRNGTPGNLTVEIQETNANGEPNGKLLGMATVLQNDIAGTSSVIDIVFGESRPFLWSGNIYAIVLRAANGNPFFNYQVRLANSGSPYAGGQVLSSTNGGTSWTKSPNADLYFVTWMGERRVAGVEFKLSGVSGTGVTVNETVLTDKKGEFWLTGLLPSVNGQGLGTGYTIAETVPAGWINTTSTSYTTNLFGRTELVGLAGQAMIPVGDLREEHIVGRPLQFGDAVHSSLHGFKFDDVDANGIYSEGIDQRLSGVQFTLNGVDGTGNVVNQAVTTDANGEFWFTQLRPSINGIGLGTGYTVTETVPIGWDATTSTTFFTNLYDATEYVAIQGQANLNPNDPRKEIVLGEPLWFGNTQRGSIHGFKFEDVDADGIYTAGTDQRMSNVEFVLTGTDGQGNILNQSVFTNANGEFWFVNLFASVNNGIGPGTGYTITEVVPAGHVPTTSTSYVTDLRSRQELVAEAGQATLVSYELLHSSDPDGPVFAPVALTAPIPITLTDLSVSGAIPIGFNFEFYGVNQTQVYLSSSGFVTFDPGSNVGCCSGQALPNVSSPNNLIALWWEDYNPQLGGTIQYQTIGVAPNRRFVLELNDIQHFPGGSPVSLRLHLIEGSNEIEIHYIDAQSDGGNHTVGVEDSHGANATTYRNQVDPPPETNTALRFTPSSKKTEVLVGAKLAFGNTIPGSIHGYKFEDLNLNGIQEVNLIPSPTFVENFDGVVAPSLPAGWTSVSAGGAETWQTSTSGPDTPPNVAFIIDAATNTDTSLVSPVIPIATTTAALSFRQAFSFDQDFDGGVLEIAIDGGAFTDIIAAGGSFVSGGYNGTLNGLENNPLGVRDAWVDSSAGYITTVVDLPDSAAGKNVQLRWRIGTGDSFGDVGWSVDTIQVGEPVSEPRLPGVTFTLTGINGQGTSVNQTVTTDANGEFWFTGLIASVSGAGFGTGYTVTETVPNSFYPSTSTTYVTNLSSGQELVAEAGQAMLAPGALQFEVVVGGPLAFGNIRAGDRIGVHRSASFYQDVNGSGAYETSDVIQGFGAISDTPIVGDWDGDGNDEIGAHRGNQFFLDFNGNGMWDGVAGGDRLYVFGIAGDKPITGDWDGDGDDEIGVHRASVFYLDVTGDGNFGPGDASYSYGITTDKPVIGDWDNNGTDNIGVFRNGTFYLDTNGNGAYNPGDPSFNFGNPGDTPITGRWTKGGPDKIGVHRGVQFFLDIDGNGTFGGIDAIEQYGASGDKPIIGNWPSPPPLLAAGGPASGGRNVAPITVNDLAPIVDAAVDVLADRGLTEQQLLLLQQVRVEIVDLDGARLGQASGHQVTIDVNAAGHGWFVDTTPHDNEEFSTVSDQGLVALGDSAAAGHIDLLTVVLHELGHVLGLDDDHVGSDLDEIMYGELDLGIRRLPN